MNNQKNKNMRKTVALICALIMVFTMATACSKAQPQNTSPVSAPSEAPTAKPTKEPATEPTNTEGSEPGEQPTDMGMMYGLPENIEGYIEPFGMDVDQKVLDELAPKYKALAVAYNETQGQLSDAENREFGKIDAVLRKHGVMIPYVSLHDFVLDVPNMSEEDQKYIRDNEKHILPEEGSAADSKESEEAYMKAGKIFKKYDLDIDEVLEQFYNMNYKIAIFDMDGKKVTLRTKNRSNVKVIDEATKQKYLSVIDQLRAITPANLWQKLDSIEFNTDGIDNVLAHTVPMDEGHNKMRLAIDIKDILDKDGNITDDGKTTIVHELGHVITLTNKQVKPQGWSDLSIVDVNKKYVEGSYLMQFHKKFWADKYNEYLKIRENTGDTLDFYDKYKDQFVTDYAASALEEDIAESFRVFVYEKKPTGDSIVDQKVKFFYQFDEFVKWRDELRKNLSLK